MGARAAIILTALGVLAAALGAGALFNSLFFQRFLVANADSRLLAVAQDTRDVFARQLDMGLPLAQFEAAAQVVAEARRADPAADPASVAVRVFQSSPLGFTAIAGETGPLPAAWVKAMNRAPAAAFWPIGDGERLGVLVPIKGSFGQTAGLVAVLQGRDQLAAAKGRFDSYVVGLALTIGLPAALVLAWAMAALTRPALSRLDQWTDHVDGRTAAPPHEAEGDLVGMLIAEPLAALRDRRP